MISDVKHLNINKMCNNQGRSQNAEIITHIKGRRLKQAGLLSDMSLGDFSYRREFAERERIVSFKRSPL